MSIKRISEYRSFLMGIGILWIVLFHSGLLFNNTMFNLVKNIGYGGVDIFLLCSGFGCYCSLSKRCDVYTFLKRRFIRICPTWIFVMVFWIPCMWILKEMPLEAMVGNLFGIQNLTGFGYDFNWYISILWIMYILAPYMVGVCNRNSFFRDIIIVGVLMIMSIPFWKNHDLIVGVSRFPIFYMGIVCGKYYRNDKMLNKQILVLLFGAMCAGAVMLLLFSYQYNAFLWDYALYWYPFLLITPGLCVLCILVAAFLIRTPAKFLVTWISHFGVISFDIYLVHIFVFDILRIAIDKKKMLNNNWVWGVAIGGIFVLSDLLHITIARLMNRWLQKE